MAEAFVQRQAFLAEGTAAAVGRMFGGMAGQTGQVSGNSGQVKKKPPVQQLENPWAYGVEIT